MRFGKLDIDPAKNPAVLDTATWGQGEAWAILTAVGVDYWRALAAAWTNGRSPTQRGLITPHPASRVAWQARQYCLASLDDGQMVLLEMGPGRAPAVLGKPIGQLAINDAAGTVLFAYPADLRTVAAYVGSLAPAKGPRVMGSRPRLGLGSRMTTASWPGVYRAMDGLGIAANAIQNSMREVSVLDDLLAGRPGEPNYGPNLGTFASGHTGSSFEGLWLYGVLEALKAPGPVEYGAEADHIQVKRGTGGLERAKRVLDSTRHYTFYTLDVSDVLHYHALTADPAEAQEMLRHAITDVVERGEVVAYHSQPHGVAGRNLKPDADDVGRLVAKYWSALDAMEELAQHVVQLRNGEPFDLEFAIDEVPAGITACDCVTTSEELLFVVRECRRRGIPLSHVAPNVGVEKEVDYRCPDGLAGMEGRIREQTELARQHDLMLDFHSGDDLTRATRRAIGRATGGRCHFKLSPSLQLIYAEALEKVCPDKFRVWWDDTLAFARREAAEGSRLARVGLESLEASSDPTPGARHDVFRHYCFASVGRRNERGQFVHREMFYDLPDEMYTLYADRLGAFVGEVADDLFGQ